MTDKCGSNDGLPSHPPALCNQAGDHEEEVLGYSGRVQFSQGPVS